MSITRQHADWLQLVEQTGPFLSMPVLLKYLPNGLEKSDEQTEVMRRLREEYGRWEENGGDRAAHHHWCRFVLQEVLDLDDNVLAEGQAIPGTLSLTVAEHKETLRPDFVVKTPPGGNEAGQPRMLIQVYPYYQDLDKQVKGRTWAASPGTRMMDLLHHTGVPLGLVTNGERWMLVHAPRNETTGFASWYAWLWQQEPITFRAFRTLLSVGWDDLEVGHGFHETKQGIRFTISEPARREVLQRLLKLNHQRYEEEVRQGLHEKKNKRKKAQGKSASRKKKAAKEPTLFDKDGDDEDTPAASAPAETEPPVQRTTKRQVRSPQPAAKDDQPLKVDQYETDEVMAAFRQAARNRGWMDREQLIKQCSQVLGYRRLGDKIKETLKNHLRAAIRRKIIEAEAAHVRLATTSMQDYWDHYADDLRGSLCSVMRNGTTYDRDEVIQAVAHHLGFTRVRDEVRTPIKSAINSAIRQGILGYEGNMIWRER